MQRERDREGESWGRENQRAERETGRDGEGDSSQGRERSLAGERLRSPAGERERSQLTGILRGERKRELLIAIIQVNYHHIML